MGAGKPSFNSVALPTQSRGNVISEKLLTDKYAAPIPVYYRFQSPIGLSESLYCRVDLLLFLNSFLVGPGAMAAPARAGYRNRTDWCGGYQYYCPALHGLADTHSAIFHWLIKVLLSAVRLTCRGLQKGKNIHFTRLVGEIEPKASLQQFLCKIKFTIP